MKKAQHQVPEETWERHGYVISHVDFPYQDYTTNINSFLVIKNLHSQQTIQIKFLIFDLYYKPGERSCYYDYLELSNTGNNKPTKFCGEPAQKPILNLWYNLTISGSNIEIKFKTNENPLSLGNGFYFEYRGK